MQKMTTRRKLAIATWSAPREGSIHGKLTVDMTQAKAYIAWAREEFGEKVTITHLVGRAVAEAMSKAPGLNGHLRLGRYIPHPWVNVTFLVVLEEGGDLGKATVKDADKKLPHEIAADLRAAAVKLRSGKDSDFEKSKGTLRALPTWLLRPIVWTTGWITGSMGWSVPALGLEAFPFGSCVITSVGMFGLDEGYAPFTPFARVPLLILIGAMRDQPVVVDGEIGIQTQLTVTATVDHRFMDGYQGGILARVVRDVLENPWQLHGLTERPSETATAPAQTTASEPPSQPLSETAP